MSELARTRLLPATREPLRVAARRLRWFREALHRYLDHVGAEIGCAFQVDDSKVAAAFVAWIRAVEAQRPADPEARREYFEFAAGLMLRELLRDVPVRAAAVPGRVDPGSAAAFWPEGYACTTFCLTVAQAALAQEFQDPGAVAPEIDDLRHWWSFRENVQEDPAVSVAFLDMLMGHEPDWLTPGLFSARLRREVGDAPGSGLLAG